MEQCVSSGVIVFILQALIFVLFYQKNMSPGQSALFYGSASVKGAGKVQKMKKNEIDTRTVGGRIKYLRKQIGMSQEELGWALKMEGKSAVYGYESNRRGLSGDVLVDLAKILRTTPEYIISGTTSAEEDSYISVAIVLLKELKTDKARKAALEHIRLVAMMEE